MAFRLRFTERAEKGADSKAFVEYLESCYTASDSVRQKFESEWATSILYLAGNQYEAAAKDFRRNGVLPRPISDNSRRRIENHILPLVRQAAGALRNSIASMEAVASTNEAKDRKAATLATKFLKYRHTADDEPEARFKEIMWSMCSGRVMRKIHWDPDAPGLSSNGVLTDKLGDIASRTISPFFTHICPWDLGSSEPEWIIESDVRDVDEIKALYDKEVNPEEINQNLTNIDKLSTDIIGGTSGGETRKNSVILKRMYVRPSVQRPKGRLAVWASGTLLQDEELPDGIFPFVCIDWFPIPGRMYPLSFIEPLRDSQNEINSMKSALSELATRQLRGDILIHGAGDVVTEYATNGQKIIRVDNSVREFEFVKYDLNTNQSNMSLQGSQSAMMQIAGIHESSLGVSPTSRTTATQVSLLKESDLQGLSLFKENFDARYAKVSMLKVLNAKIHYTTPRMIRVVGQNNNLDTAAFFGSELRSTSDIRAVAKPLMTESMKAQIMTDFGAQGLFGPFEGPLQKRAAIERLLLSGLPDIDEVVAGMIAPFELEQFRAITAKLEQQQMELFALNNEASALQIQMGIMQMQQQMNPPQQQVPAVDNDGNPIQDQGVPQQAPAQPQTPAL